MRKFTKFAAAAALSLSMAAGAANAGTIVDIAQSNSSGVNIFWDSATNQLTVTGIAANLDFDDAFYAGADLDAVLTLTATTADPLSLPGGGVFIQTGLTGTFDFRSEDNSISYLSGTFSDYWLNGFTGGNSGSLNNAGGTGTANFTSSFAGAVNGVYGDNFGISFQSVSPVFSVTGGELDDFSGRAIVGTFGGVVPEPGTWALMIVGFGGAGAMLRSRRRTVAAAA